MLFTSFIPAVVTSGLTKVLQLKVDSIALDAGGTGCSSTDQRDLPRPVNKGGGNFCDIGAYEEQ